MAHEGHDHGEVKPAIVSSSDPRVSAYSDSYELLGQIETTSEGQSLIIWLDDFATNQPVTTATLKAIVNGKEYPAQKNPDGTYRIKADWIGTAGKTDITFAIDASSGPDLLAGTLDVQGDNLFQTGLNWTGSTLVLALVAILGLFVLNIFLGKLIKHPKTKKPLQDNPVTSVQSPTKPQPPPENLLKAVEEPPLPPVQDILIEPGQGKPLDVEKPFVKTAQIINPVQQELVQDVLVEPGQNKPVEATKPFVRPVQEEPVPDQRWGNRAYRPKPLLQEQMRETPLQAQQRETPFTQAEAQLQEQLTMLRQSTQNSEMQKEDLVKSPLPFGGLSAYRPLGLVLMALSIPLLLSWPILAHEGHDHGAPVAVTSGFDTPQRLPNGDLFIPKATQRLLSIRTIIVDKANASRTLELQGQIAPEPDGIGRVQSVVDGRFDTAPNGLPVVGQRVSKGQILGYIVPTVSAADRSSFEGSVGDLDTRILLAEQKLSRITRLAGIVPQKDIDETRIEVKSLKERRIAVKAAVSGREPLLSPISGLVSTVHTLPGQIVSARDNLFEIVDPARLWVEANSFDETVQKDSIVDAYAQISDTESIPLQFIGQSLTLRQQSVPFVFKLLKAPRNAGIGKPVTVLLKTNARVEGIIVPRAAVIRGNNGLSQVWTHSSAETFRPKIVKASSLDGERLVVETGLDPKERVVVEGATILGQVR